MWHAELLGVVEAEMRDALELARTRLAGAGAEVANFDASEAILEAAASAHPVVMAYEAARERAEDLVVADQLSEPLARLLHTGAGISTREYEDARNTIAAAAAHVAQLLTDYDVIIGPAAPSVAPEGLEATGVPILSRPWQAMNLPVVTVPGLHSTAGLPLGVQAVGRPQGESDLLTTSCWIERLLV